MFIMRKKIAKSAQFLTETNLPPATVVEQAKQIERVENFFVGLPDDSLPQPRNVLMFQSGREDLKAPTPNAAHQRHLLIFNLQAEATVMLDSLMTPLLPGQALLIFPFQTHSYLVQGNAPLNWLFVSFDLADSDTLHQMRNRPVNVPSNLWPLLEALMIEYRTAFAKQETGAATATLLSYLLLRLQRECRQTTATPWDPRQALPTHRIVQRASQHIAVHLRDALSVRQIAATLTVSEGYLRTCFRRVLGITVTMHIRRTRVYTACSLLSRTESNITQIAEHCGFGSVYAFSRAFKREIGMSPRTYRKHLWEGQNRTIADKNRNEP